jgi:translation initiation factor 3 subunit C
VQEDLAKLFEKTRPVIIREGLTMPRFYIRYLVELEDFINEQWEDREGRKVMSKANSKGLTALRQKLRKYNKDFESDIADYRKDSDPVGYSSAEDAVVDNDVVLSADDDEPTAVVEKGKPKRMRKALDEDSDSDWDSDGESSESELSDIEGKQMEDLRKFFLKYAAVLTE